MFSLAVLIGIYSYIIFGLGILGLIFKPIIILATIVWILVCFYCFRKPLANFLNTIKNESKFIKIYPKQLIIRIKKNKITSLLLFLLILQMLVNLIGVFGPEISFDALWYHLTLPTLYLLANSVFHIPGGLLYYSDMPKLTEMLYLGGLTFGSETIAKLIHFTFGVLVLISIYKISGKFLPKKYSLISALIFYSSLVVGWESIAAYVDLSRTFFELMTLWGFLNWIEKKNFRWLLISGLMLGLAIAAKLIAVESLIIFLGLFVYEAYLKKTEIRMLIKNYSVFTLTAIIVPLPWFIFSFLNTGNPFYPYFGKLAVDSGQSFSIPNFSFILRDFYNLFLNLSDPISPLYLILLPLILISLRKSEFRIKLFAIYTFLAVLIWYLTLEARGGRFILPYLPIFSILASYSIYKLKNRSLRIFLIITVILVVLSSISYRFLANSKYIPVILGKETKSQFLTKNLNFSFGDFYDIDGYFQKNIKPSDKVLLYGFHNLYYVNFPFVDSSFVKMGDKFNYIAVQNSIIPIRFSDWKQIYYNKITKVGLYSKERKIWVY